MFSNYVDTFTQYLAAGVTLLPVVILQLFKNMNNTSRILWNPDIPEAGGNCIVPLFDDFLGMYQRKILHELQITEEEGTFIVNATIVSVLRDEQWWCGACKCHKDVTPDGGLYYSPNCSTHVVEVIPRGLKVGEHSSEFLGLIGEELLFKVEKTAEYTFNYDDSFRVKKVCAELEIIQQFKKSFIVESPLKLCILMHALAQVCMLNPN
ncbi:Nucleic acid-binding, OB-fold [Sesbania bispinosa]|nr:Nucleic acid-binding, OB-fold [Sesbania bispinosa]